MPKWESLDNKGLCGTKLKHLTVVIFQHLKPAVSCIKQSCDCAPACWKPPLCIGQNMVSVRWVVVIGEEVVMGIGLYSRWECSPLGLECRNVNSLVYLGQLDAVHFPSCPLGVSAAPQTFPLTAASYLHSTSTSLHSICYMSSFHFFFLSQRGFLQSTLWSHQSTEMALVGATSHIKVIRPPCLFQLPPWENIIRSTTLIKINSMWVTSSYHRLYV